jgi:N-acetylneuraminate synthase
MSICLIAGIGINHKGDLSIAKDLIKLAESAGCKAVKFQKRTVELVYTKELLASPHENPRVQRNGREERVLSMRTMSTMKSIVIASR